MEKKKSLSISHYLNEQGASAVKVIAITIIILLLIGGAASIAFTIQDKSVEFTDEEIASADLVAQSVFEEASMVAESTTVEQQEEALKTIGYEENRRDQTTITYEQPNSDLDYYVLLKLQPHDTYPNLSRILVQVFDKEHRVLMTELSNVLTWQTTE